MKKSIRVAVGLIAGMSVLPKSAWAQGPLPPLAAPPPSTPAPPATAPPAPPPPPPQAPPPPPAPVREIHETDDDASPSDHDRFVKHLGITYFDVTSLPIANPVGTGGSGTPTLTPGSVTSSTIAAPVVGVRYWVQRAIGIDLGLGLGFAGGSQEAVNSGTDVTVGKVGTTGFAFHAGLPIVFYEGRHYAFLVIPQFTVGATSGKLTPAAANFPGATASPEQDLSGFLFDGGAKIGAEVYFGFIGLPELALQATVGLSYRRSVFKLASGGNSASDGTSTFGTNVGANPWAIFTNNVSATYYF